jgi:transposase
VFGAVSVSTPKPKFHFRFTKDKFNNTSFIVFLEQLLRYYSLRHQKIYLIVDGASYHKKVLDWVAERSNEIELHFLPPYSPNLNPVEQIWRRTKTAATHNRYFSTMESLRDALFRRFNRYQGNSASIQTTVASWS